MAFTLAQPAYGQAGSYTALQDRFVLWGQAVTPGVVRLGAVSGGASTGDLAVTVGTTTSTVKVAAGHGFVYGGSGQGVYHVYNDADISSAAFASCPTNTRIDLVVVQVTDNGVAAPSVAISIVQGTAAASPTPPATPAKSLALAKVLIQNGFVSGTTNVLAANITDLRPKAQLPDLSIPSITNNLSTGRVDTPYAPQTGNVIYDTSTPATPLLKVYNGASWDTFPKSGAIALADFASTSAPVSISASTAAPSPLAEGLLWYQTDTNALFVYTGAAWSQIATWDNWTSWTPTYTNITVGTGATNTGAYTRMGKLVMFYASLTLGTSPSYGAAQIYINLPVGTTANRVTGTVFVSRSTSNYIWSLNAGAGSTSAMVVYPVITPTAGNNGQVSGTMGSSGVLVAAAGDVLNFTGWYVTT